MFFFQNIIGEFLRWNPVTITVFNEDQIEFNNSIRIHPMFGNQFKNGIIPMLVINLIFINEKKNLTRVQIFLYIQKEMEM